MTYYTAEQQVESLRSLADFIETNPDLPWGGYSGGHKWSLIYHSATDVAAFASVQGGWDKEAYGDNGRGNVELLRKFGDALTLAIIVPRDTVCERVVVGTEHVAVPDPEALAEVPHTFVEREIVEWRCGSVLQAATR